MFELAFLDIYNNIWPMALIVLTIIISLRLSYIFLYRPKFNIYDEILMLSFIIYIMCLFYVVTFQDYGRGNSNFIPFNEILRYSFLSKGFIRNIVGNLIMFVPFGFFTAYFLRVKRYHVPFIICMLVSMIIELTQTQIGRVFDIDDIILNVIGGIIGYLIYKILYKIKEIIPIKLRLIIYNVSVLSLFLTIIGYLYKLIVRSR